jgi:cytochrome c oxidase subunit 2
MGMLKRAAGLFAAVATAGVGAQAWAADLLGQPTPGAIDMQPAGAPLRHQQMFFHNVILLPIITAIVLLVLALLLWCAIRFNKRANPTPARWSHNTPIEVLWTVVPVLILMFISIFSFKLLYAFHDLPKPDVTVKATGNQWYWSYEYPDLNVSEYTSVLLPEDQAKARGVPFRLAADNPMVVPVNKTVRVLVTGADVIHSWTVPAFGVKIDAVPGRVNQTWFRAEREGVYYGQCSELCGVDHAFMPIEVRVVSEPEFEAWVKSKGGSMTPPAPAAPAAAVPANATAAAAPASGAAAATAASTPAASAAPVASSAAAAPAASAAPAAAH